MGEATKSVIDNLKPIDDTFIQKLIEHLGFCEELLQTVLQLPDLHLIKVTPQCSLHNIDSRSVTVDALCEDSIGRLFSIEVQKSNTDNHQKRVRYNGACVQTIKFDKGTLFKQLFNLHMIYISDFDIFNKEKTVYHIIRVIKETDDTVDNGYYEIYVNTKVNDGTDIAELMQILKSPEIPNNAKFPRICEIIRYYKEGRGKTKMCEVVEKYAREYAKEHMVNEKRKYAIRMMQNGLTDEQISLFLDISFDEISTIHTIQNSEENLITI